MWCYVFGSHVFLFLCMCVGLGSEYFVCVCIISYANFIIKKHINTCSVSVVCAFRTPFVAIAITLLLTLIYDTSRMQCTYVYTSSYALYVTLPNTKHAVRRNVCDAIITHKCGKTVGSLAIARARDRTENAKKMMTLFRWIHAHEGMRRISPPLESSRHRCAATRYYIYLFLCTRARAKHASLLRRTTQTNVPRLHGAQQTIGARTARSRRRKNAHTHAYMNTVCVRGACLNKARARV